MTKGNSAFLLVFILLFSAGCTTSEEKADMLAFNPTVGNICDLSKMYEENKAIVRAAPNGLSILKSRDGEELAIVPDKNVVYIFTGDYKGWSYIAWESPSGKVICGYSDSKFIEIANPEK